MHLGEEVLSAVDTDFKYLPVHPFPARMAPDIAFRALGLLSAKRATVLDPMAGSGTTLLAAKLRGYECIGFDSDPLAVIIANAWAQPFPRASLFAGAERVNKKAELIYARGAHCPQYPNGADVETVEFIRFWFNPSSRRQLYALSCAISEELESPIRNLLWCAFSRLIIAKERGASLARDLPHSRPHRDIKRKCLQPIKSFIGSVIEVSRRAPFADRPFLGASPLVRLGDARNLPILSNSVDLVITSPPYLNAIDYLRGHKFSLVWMGLNIRDIRRIRADAIGTEAGLSIEHLRHHLVQAVGALGDTSRLGGALGRTILRYAWDMDRSISEISRVLKPKCYAVIVVGESRLRGTLLRNAQMLRALAKNAGLRHLNSRRRFIPRNRRYLPPPSNSHFKTGMSARMNSEIILEFVKEV